MKPTYYMSKFIKLLTYLNISIIITCVSNHSLVTAQLSDTISYVDGEIVLMFQPDTIYSQRIKLIKSINPNYKLIEYEDDFLLISIGKSESMTDSIKKYLASELIYSAEPNYIVSTFNITNDTYINSQWPIKNTGSYRSFSKSTTKNNYSTKGIDLNLEKAWDYYNHKTFAKNEVIVAIIDTGIDITHKDLKKHIWTNDAEIQGDGIDNDGNGYVDDTHGWDFYNNDSSVYHYEFERQTFSYNADPNDNDDHGTHVAGIIGAVANNKLGIAGVASNINIKLMPLKIEGGSKGNGTISDAIKAIKYATKMGAKVCNISWGSDIYSTSLMQTMKESNMLFICAAGNTGTNNDKSPIYPASYNLSNVISVTFIDSKGKLCALANYGKKTVDIAAPGYDILSTTVGGTYSSMSGSSMAVPHVTGIAAMLYANDNYMYPSNVKEIILNNVHQISSLKNKVKTPAIPNAFSAVTSLKDIKRDTESPTLSVATSYKKNKIKLSLK